MMVRLASIGYPWSSLVWYVAAPEHRPKWIRVDRLLGEHGIQQDSAAGRQHFERQMETRRLEETDEEALKIFRRGWCLGSRESREELLQKLDGKVGENHAGKLRLETAQARADRILAEELERLGWSDSELVTRRKSDPNKLAIAARLREETTLTIKSIAAKVHLGISKSANVRLHAWMNNQTNANASHQHQFGI
jgi:hypothetical protein